MIRFEQTANTVDITFDTWSEAYNVIEVLRARGIYGSRWERGIGMSILLGDKVKSLSDIHTILVDFLEQKVENARRF